jgi:hypothetical protein
MDQDQMVAVQVRLPLSVVQWLDQYRHTLAIRPSRAQVIRYLLDKSRKCQEQEEDGTRSYGNDYPHSHD